MALRIRSFRATIKPLLILFAVLVITIIVYQSILPLVAFFLPAFEPLFFDLGVFGAYPTEEFASFDLQPPRALQLQWDSRCDGGYVLLTPNGPSVSRPGPMILNAQGDLVWMSDEYGPSANLKVQRYRGHDYLTFWAGEKAATSGKGKYYMLDETYSVVRTISAVGQGLYGDLHEFKITDNNTALLTVYNVTTADLSPMGRPARGWITDSMFQEIDIETGSLLFEWKASEHFDPNLSFMTNPIGGYIPSLPFDYYHINSIDLDHHGNYLISSRHFHTLTCISRDGVILWNLGGRNNAFTDLSGGEASNFRWQHDARWLSSEDGILSVFDNGKGGTLHADSPYSRALILQLDVVNRTVSLVHSFTSRHNLLAGSQGAMQVMPSTDQVFVGWGSAAAYSEYSTDGDLLCETHLGASWYFTWERMKSYRMVKVQEWRGSPLAAPQVVLDGNELFVSWNGATEVAYWALEALRSGRKDENDATEVQPEQFSDSPNDGFESMDIIRRDGFESVFDLSELNAPASRYRVVALDADHNILRHSNLVTYERETRRLLSTALFLVFSLAGLVFGFRLLLKHSKTTRKILLRPWQT